MFLVFEYVDHDLALLLDNMQQPFTESEVKCLMKQLLLGVAYLHEHWVIHRDIKSSNLLYNNRGQLKLADFGLARTYGSPLKMITPKVVTIWYRCPELLLGQSTYGTPVDMWSVGCIFGELLLHTPLLPGRTEVEQLQRICRLLGNPTEKIWPGVTSLPLAKEMLGAAPCVPYSALRQKFAKYSDSCYNLLDRLLTYDPLKRLTAAQAVAHPYFTEHPLAKSMDMMPTFPDRAEVVRSGAQHAKAPAGSYGTGANGGGIFHGAAHGYAQPQRERDRQQRLRAAVAAPGGFQRFAFDDDSDCLGNSLLS
eukprot:TRINITY_DN7847_c0_g1_i3.p1 TRINITY_DN7847_c0_g1~~TRINITY_DN7847_c0_g1_i3.p1  ORF type:complete len:308 (+),score=81.80 TRINITY_DN7847_c0_g1_i3:140-1063(+)